MAPLFSTTMDHSGEATTRSLERRQGQAKTLTLHWQVAGGRTVPRTW